MDMLFKGIFDALLGKWKVSLMWIIVLCFVWLKQELASKYVMMSPFCMRKITKSKLQENTIQRRNWILNLVVSLNLFRPLCWKSYNPPACITNTLPDVWLFTICLIKSLKFMVSSLVSIWKLSFLSCKLVYKYLCQLVSFSCLQVWKADEST